MVDYWVALMAASRDKKKDLQTVEHWEACQVVWRVAKKEPH